MKASEIINDVANSREYVQICKNIAQADHQDLFQELILILCEYNRLKLEQIYANGYIKWFIVRILKNQFCSVNSPFYKKNKEFLLRSQQIDFTKSSIIIEDYDDSKDSIIDHCLKELDTSNCDKDQYYERTLFKEYMEAGSYEKLAKKTGINRKSIQYTIQKVKKDIRDNL